MPAKKCYHYNNCMYQSQNIALCSPSKCGHYEKVKKFTDVQQLKAEIAALATELDDFNERRISRFGRVDEIATKMRQLSAV